MARTYKKRSKKMSKRKNFKRAGVGSSTTLRAAKTIQRSAHKAFDFLADDCTICLESMALKSKVVPISCGHGMHKKCLKDLLTSPAFTNPTNRKCPMCRTPAPEFQVLDHDNDLNILIRDLVERHVDNQVYFPRILATPENIDKLIILCKTEIGKMGYERSQLPHRIMNYVIPIASRINNRWNDLMKRLDMINKSIRNKTGQIKTKVGKPTLESLKDNYLPFVISHRIFLREYGITIPDETNRQIDEITTLFREKNIAMPTQEQIDRISRQMF